MQDSEMEKKENNENIVEPTKYTGVFLSNIVAVPYVNITCDIRDVGELRGLRKAFERGENVVLLASVDGIQNPTINDFCSVGCVCEIKQFTQTDKMTKVVMQGVNRVKIDRIESILPDFVLYATPLAEVNASTVVAYQRMNEIKVTLRELNRKEPFLPPLLENQLLNMEATPSKFADILIHLVAKGDIRTQQLLLEELNVEERLAIIQRLMTNVAEMVALKQKIDRKVNDSIAKSQKEMFLREQLHAINDELNGELSENEEFREKVKKLGLSKENEEKVLKEINRLEKLPFGSPELGYIRNFVETVLELPWTQKTEDKLDIVEARKVLDKDHYALDKVKDRIVETLAVIKLTGKVNGQIICLVGPPGVGKTSIAKSIATAMGRKFVQVSLGGVSDESVIRGHRRTYVGAMCGRILAGMKQAGTINPVFLLDEIDKLSRDIKGDPASALLEVLDPAQNDHFKDNFLEMPYDLSQVMFILTANTLETIPRPLLDRMEVIEVRSYTELEKIQIAKRHLIAKQEEMAGLKPGTVPFTDEILSNIIRKYTFEAGVRSFERCIATVCRKYATRVVDGKKFKDISVQNLRDYLGNDYASEPEIYQGGNVGEVVGLGVNGAGGSPILIEALAVYGADKIVLTGQMGDVFKESTEAAYTLIMSMADELNINPLAFSRSTLHLHHPQSSGVEGPSAGIATATAIASAYTNRPVRPLLAMTGEVSLRGRVLPIGGVRDKLIAAARTGIQTVIVPKDNEHNLDDLPDDIRKKLDIRLVTDIHEVFDIALGEPLPQKTSLQKLIERDQKELENKKQGELPSGTGTKIFEQNVI